MSTIDVVLPALPPTPAATTRSAQRPLSTTALRILLVDNGKPKARELLTGLAEAMSSRVTVTSVVHHRKASASVVLAAEEARDLAAQHDVAITGLGDCGGCSAGSLQDALALERAGLPATVLITEPFQGLVADLAARLGDLPGYRAVVLPHPVSSKDDVVLAELAQRAAPDALECLVEVAR